MAWTFSTYHEVLRDLRDAYDVDYFEAQEMYRALHDELDGPVFPRDLMDADFIDEVVEDAGFEIREYADFDPYDWEDEYFDPGDELEVTAELAYEEGK